MKPKSVEGKQRDSVPEVLSQNHTHGVQLTLNASAVSHYLTDGMTPRCVHVYVLRGAKCVWRLVNNLKNRF